MGAAGRSAASYDRILGKESAQTTNARAVDTRQLGGGLGGGTAQRALIEGMQNLGDLGVAFLLQYQPFSHA